MIKTEDGDILLTLTEAEEAIEHELSARYIGNLARIERIKGVSLGKNSVLISLRSLHEYLASKRKPGPRRKQPVIEK